MSVQAPDALAVVDQIAQRLANRFGDSVDGDMVHDIVLDSLRRYRHLDHPSHHARALTAQLANDRLEALRWSSEHASTSRPPSVVFVCSGNAGRSQIAAALMRSMSDASVRVVSAGDRPAARVLPAVIDALDEIGVATFGEYPKPLTPEFVNSADHIVVMNCDEVLDSLAGRAFSTWSISLDGTTGKQGLRRTRDEITERVRELKLTLNAADPPRQR